MTVARDTSVDDYRVFFQRAPVGLARVGSDGRWLEVNDHFARMLGYSQEELRQLPFRDITHPDDRDRDVDAASRLARGELDEYVVEKRYVRKDGTTIWARLRSTYVSGPQDGDGHFISVIEDVTARHEAEAALRRSEARYAALGEAPAASENDLRTMLDALPTLAWTARPDGFIDWYNARWYEYTGTAPKEMEGWGWQSVHHPEALPQVLERWRLSINTGQPFEMTFPLRSASGEFRQFLTRVSPVRHSDGSVRRWFGTNTDVDAERAARSAAERARNAAEEANEAKMHFLAMMSHELRTPLNAIAGYTDLLALGVHGPVAEEQHDALARIQRSQRHLLGLINDVLNFAKLEAGQVHYTLTDVRVGQAVDELEALITPQLEARHLQLRREANTDLVVRADEEKFGQILINLLSNAIKFTEPGGTISIRYHEDGGRVSVSVHDTGIGIPGDRLEQIFAPFVQVNRKLTSRRDGTGLGLAISRDLARAMGGDISVTSTPGAGSTFTVTLPRA